MNRGVVYRVASLDDPRGVAAVSALVRDWEPGLELYRPPRDALLYESDGTLYAVALGDAMTFRTDRRAVAIRKGDAVVVPRAFAVDAGPDVDLLAVRHDGPPPDHFRERFIQVWGFEHFPAPPPDPARHGSTEVIPTTDVRHRIPYAVVDVKSAVKSVSVEGREAVVFLGLQGGTEVLLEGSGGETRVSLPPGSLLVVLPAGRCRVAGEGRVGVLTLLNELTNAGRRCDLGGSATPLSPEYRPARPDGNGP